MQWIMELSRGGDEMDAVWSQSAAADILLSNPLSAVSRSGFEHSVTICKKESVIGSLQWFAQLELDLAIIRTRLAFGNGQQDAYSSMQTIQCSRVEVEAYDTSEQGARDAKSKWILSSLYLTLTEYSAASGNFTEALNHSQEACRHCMAVVSLVRSSRNVLGDEIGPPWASVSRSTLLPRAKQRYSELLSLRSRLYMRVGDHRKAVAYLATLSDFLGIKSERIDPETCIDIQALLNRYSVLQEAKFRRLSAEIRCSATSQDIFAKGVENSGKTWLLEAWSQSNDISRQIQVILDVLSGTSMGPVIFQRTMPNLTFFRLSCYSR
jgi:hypothetical protein